MIMKTRNVLLTALFIAFLLPTALMAQTDKNPEGNDLVSQYELDKSIVQINTTNIATGFQAAFNSIVEDTTERAHLCQAFVEDARFFPDESGYFFIETIEDASVIAHANPDLIGTSRIDVQDIYGKYFIRDLVSTVKHIGYGFVEYYRRNLVTNETERKLSFVTGIPAASWFIGAGFYGDPEKNYYEPVDANKQIIEEVTTTIAYGLGGIFENIYTDPSDRIEFCRKFIDYIRFFDDQSGYFFIYDSDCMNIAHGIQKDLQGQDLTEYQDPNGNFVIQGLLEIVENDGKGFYEYYWNNPATRQQEPKMAFVIGIPGTDYFIGSGIYL